MSDIEEYTKCFEIERLMFLTEIITAEPISDIRVAKL